MSIAINSNFQRDQLIATAGQTVFAYSFPIFSEDYIAVYKRANATTPNDKTQRLTLAIDYTVQGVGEETGGTITLTVGAAVNDIITIAGVEPIERVSQFQDLNPFTTSLNQQLNTQTIFDNQVYTYWANLTPHYNFDELVSAPGQHTPGVRPDKLILPMLPPGHVWVGRGNIGENPDDIVTEPITPFGDNIVTADHPGMRPSIALWTGTDFVQTDSNINITGNTFAPIVGDTILFAGSALRLPVGTTAERPAAPQDGDVRGNTDNKIFEYYFNGDWREWAIATLPVQDASLTVWNGNRNEIAPSEINLTGTIFTPIVGDTITFDGAAVAVPIGTTGARPLAPANGDFRLNTTFNEPEMYINGTWVQFGGGGGGGDTSTDTINDPMHTFMLSDIGKAVYVSASDTYTLANASNVVTAEVAGVLVGVVVGVSYTVQQTGKNINFSGLVAGSVYWLSDMTNGVLTTLQPTTPGSVLKPVLIAITASSAWILSMPGVVVGSGPTPPPSPDDTQQQQVTQTAHGFGRGDILRIDYDAGHPTVGKYVKAQADTYAHSQVVGMVVKVLDVDNFIIQFSGFWSGDWSGLIPGTLYYLDETFEGSITDMAPSGLNEVVRLVIIAYTPTSGWLFEQYGPVNLGVPATPVQHDFTQTGGFPVKTIVRIDAPNHWAAAEANSLVNADSIGMVIASSGDDFTVQQSGWISGLSGFTAGAKYWLDPATPGAITTTKPTVVGQVLNPVFWALTSTSGWILEQGQELIQTSDTTTQQIITQMGHGFAVKHWLRIDATDHYTKGQADSLVHASVVGMVVQVIDANTFVIQQDGFTSTVTGVTPAQYYLDPVTPGGMTTIKPTAAGQVVKEVFFGQNTTSGWIQEHVSQLIGGAPTGSGLVVQALYFKTLVNATYNNSAVIPSPNLITPVTGTITPTSAANNVRWIITMSCCANSSNFVTFVLLRNGVVIPGAQGGSGSFKGVASLNPVPSPVVGISPQTQICIDYIDSPATTSPVTYTIGIIGFAGGISLNGNTVPAGFPGITTWSLSEITP